MNMECFINSLQYFSSISLKLNFTASHVLLNPIVDLSLHFRITLELFSPSPNLASPDEASFTVENSGFLAKFKVDGRIVSEVLDVQMLHKLTDLILSQMTIKKISNSPNQFLQVLLHLFIEKEEHVRMILHCPFAIRMK